jgi:hypothetical protein
VDAEQNEGVQGGNTDPELSDLTVKVAGNEALSQQLHSMHLGFNSASEVASASSSQEWGATPAVSTF